MNKLIQILLIFFLLSGSAMAITNYVNTDFDYRSIFSIFHIYSIQGSTANFSAYYGNGAGLTNIVYSESDPIFLLENTTLWSAINLVTNRQGADNITLTSSINNLIQRESADNSTQSLQIASLQNDNTTQGTLISDLTTRESSDNTTQAGLISALTTKELADNTTQSGLINAKASPGICTGTSLVQNTTTSGVQCYTLTGLTDTNDTAAVIALTARELADNSSQAGLITSVTNIESANNVTQALAINDLSSTVGLLTTKEAADNTTQGSQISTLTSRQSADNTTQAGLISTVTTRELADNSTQAGLISALDAREAANNISNTAYTDSKLITYFYNASTIQVVTGTPQGTIANLQTYNDVSYNITEVNADFEFLVNFTGVPEFNQIVIRYLSPADESSHTVGIYLWDYSTSSWESYTTLGHTDGQYNIEAIGVFDSFNHVGPNNITQIRVYTNNIASSTHKWQFDWITISKGVATPSSTETDPFSVHKDGSTALTANWNVGSFNITADTVYAKVNASDIQNVPWAIKTAAEIITGSWIFNPSNNVSFSSGKVYFYSPVYFLNNVTLTNSNGLSVNTSYLIKTIGGDVVGNWSLNPTTNKAYLTTDGNITATDQFLGKLNASYIQNPPWKTVLASDADNTTQATEISTKASAALEAANNVTQGIEIQARVPWASLVAAVGNWSLDKTQVWASITEANNTAKAAMPKTGGSFTGNVSITGSNILTVSGNGTCLVAGTNGCMLYQNTTCTVLYSPNRLTKDEVCN